MKAHLRFLLPAVFAAWLALPGIGSDGGENAGGTGVWILPRPTFLASGAPEITAATPDRGALAVPTVISGPISVAAASELGSFTATLTDPISGVATSLPTNGREFTLTSAMLMGLKSSGAGAHIVVSDSQQLGYVLRVSFDPATGSGSIKVY